MKKYLVSATIKETSPRFKKVNAIYGNELQEFKIKSDNEQQVIENLAFTYVNELKKFYNLGHYDLGAINYINISDIAYVICEL